MENKCQSILFKKNSILMSNPSYSYKILICETTSPEQVRTFISNSFINVFYEPSYLDLYEEDPFFERESIFTVNRYQIYASNVQPDYSLFVNYLKNRIEKGYFAIAHWDQYYLPDSDYYLKNHFDEEHLVYGIDLNKKKVYAFSSSFDARRDYSVSFKDYFCSNLLFSKSNITYQFVKYNPEYSSELNLVKIKNDLYDYLKSTCRFYFNVHQERRYGLNAFRYYIARLGSMLTSDNTDITLHTCVICDHILLTQIRLQELSSANIIDEQFVNRYNQMSVFKDRIFHISKNLRMDYSESKKKSLIELLSDYCHQEEEILNSILPLLQKSIKEGMIKR